MPLIFALSADESPEHVQKIMDHPFNDRFCILEQDQINEIIEAVLLNKNFAHEGNHNVLEESESSNSSLRHKLEEEEKEDSQNEEVLSD